MQKPNDSLDDFIVRPEVINNEPPRTVELRFTGEVEVLKPLAVWVPPPVKAAGLSWFHRSLVAGGAFAAVAVVLGSAIFIAMYEGNTEVARVDQVNETAQVEEFVSPDGNLLTEEFTPDVFTMPERKTKVEGVTKRSLRSKRSFYSAFKIRHSSFKRTRRTQPTLEPFVPTTLIIYIDKGEVKSRIEPQLTAGYKKTPTLSN